MAGVSRDLMKVVVRWSPAHFKHLGGRPQFAGLTSVALDYGFDRFADFPGYLGILNNPDIFIEILKCNCRIGHYKVERSILCGH